MRTPAAKILGGILCVGALLLNTAIPAADTQFSIAVIPDTQNYVDYNQQRAAGFPFDAGDLFLEQMRYIATNARSQGGDIVFATSLGDVWQHSSLEMDPEHVARGFKRVPNPIFSYYEMPAPQTRAIEIPIVVRGYEIIAGKLPFSVVPGNHDYDAMWTDAKHPPQPAREGSRAFGLIHFTGLTNFRSVFSEQSNFFKDKNWYVAAHEGGADSAQLFTAGGYRFLHIGLQFDPPDASIDWAQSVLERYPDLPTLISTHHYLAPNGARSAPVLSDPERNQPQALWERLIRRNGQIFLILSGHRCTQGFRAENNASGNRVYSILSDYQCRAQVLKEVRSTTSPEITSVGLGDGWLRLLQFDMGASSPRLRVRTYSTHYKAFSTDLPEYAKWYKLAERPGYTDEEFLAEDDFVIELSDFRQRFGRPKTSGHPRRLTNELAF